MISPSTPASAATSATTPETAPSRTIWQTSSGALRSASLLVICTPVYTNTVPGGLKIFIDRCQAYHAEKNLFTGGGEKKGLLLSVAGRTGTANFTCVKKVVVSFMRNLGIRYAGEVLLDRMDSVRDVRTLPGIREEISGLIQDAFRP